jgi:hypothetical protein
MGRLPKCEVPALRFGAAVRTTRLHPPGTTLPSRSRRRRRRLGHPPRARAWRGRIEPGSPAALPLPHRLRARPASPHPRAAALLTVAARARRHGRLPLGGRSLVWRCARPALGPAQHVRDLGLPLGHLDGRGSEGSEGSEGGE